MYIKIKKTLIAGLAISVLGCLLLAGCSNNGDGRNSNSSTGVSDVIEAQTTTNASTEEAATSRQESSTSEVTTVSDQTTTNPADVEISPEAIETMSSTEGVDIDLTALSSNMVYAEVYNLMYTPDDYVGKVVKMQGNFAVYEDEAGEKNYFACLIKDAAACCAQGIEFELAGEHTYPDDYPELESEITVIGTFDTYKEGQFQYCTLRNAEMVE